MIRAISGVVLIWTIAGYAAFHALTTDETNTRETPAPETAPSYTPHDPPPLVEISEQQLATLLFYAPPTAEPTPDINVAKDLLSDGTYVWKWGAWRDPITDKAYESPSSRFFVAPQESSNPNYSAPTYSAPSSQASGNTSYEACINNPDRYNWMAYAVQYDWPLDELANVIQHESGGDLCAVNPSSGATCWIQQHPGGSAFFDPATCMSQGYAKWLDGGGSFYTHWYRFW